MIGLAAIGLQIAPAAVALPGEAVSLIGGVSLVGKTQLSPGGARILLSNLSVPSNAAIGDNVGTLSVVGGSGSYTFTLTSNPGGLFSITGNTLKVAAALSAGIDPISIKADNGAGSVVTQPFNITVTDSALNSLDFSKPSNSQYIPVVAI